MNTAKNGANNTAGTLVLVACLVSLLSCQQRPKASDGGDDARRNSDTLGLTLDPQARRRAGIETQTLRASARGGQVQLAGELIADPSRVTTVQSPVAGRLAAVDGGHWPAFGERVGAGTVLAQVSDAKPLVADRGGTVTMVNAQPGQLVQPGQVLLELSDLSAPLARIVWRGDAPLPAPGTIILVPLLEERQEITGRLVGPAPGVDSLTRLPAYLYRAARGWRGAGPGSPVVATVAAAGAPSRGLFVPEAAVVQWEGLAWVYVEHSGDRFSYARERVDTSQPVAGGWLVAGGALAGGDAVVVRGAQQLLSEEFKSRATTGDDDQ